METGQASLQGAGVVLHKDGTRTPFVISGDVPPGQEEATQRLVDRFNSQYQSQAEMEDPDADERVPIEDPMPDEPLDPDEEQEPDSDPPGELDPQGV